VVPLQSRFHGLAPALELIPTRTTLSPARWGPEDLTPWAGGAGEVHGDDGRGFPRVTNWRQPEPRQTTNSGKLQRALSVWASSSPVAVLPGGWG